MLRQAREWPLLSNLECVLCVLEIKPYMLEKATLCEEKASDSYKFVGLVVEPSILILDLLKYVYSDEFQKRSSTKNWHLKSDEFGVLFTYFSDRKVYSGNVFVQLHMSRYYSTFEKLCFSGEKSFVETVKQVLSWKKFSSSSGALACIFLNRGSVS